jgi:DNA replication and repair protein RecF
LGVQREQSGARVIRANGETLQQASELARYLPSLLLGPHTVELLTGPPGVRRSFLNWGVFHVEPKFGAWWQDGQRILKQRNAILKAGGAGSDISVWTEQLVSVTEKIDVARRAYFEAFLPVFTETYRFLLGVEGVKCRYRRGWPPDRELPAVYESQEESDRQRRFTQSGFHRADIQVWIDGNPVAQTCSRGELKLISWAMVLAQGRLMAGNSAVFLVDDLTAELDDKHRKTIAALLQQIGGQVLVTGTDSDSLRGLWEEGSGKLFHVEQGQIREQEHSE